MRTYQHRYIFGRELNIGNDTWRFEAPHHEEARRIVNGIMRFIRREGGWAESHELIEIKNISRSSGFYLPSIRDYEDACAYAHVRAKKK